MEKELRTIANYVGYCPRSWGDKQQRELLKRVQEKMGVENFSDALKLIDKARKQAEKEREKAEKQAEKAKAKFAHDYNVFHTEITSKGVVISEKNIPYLEHFIHAHIFTDGACDVVVADNFEATTDYSLDWNYYAKSCKYPHKDYRLCVEIPKNTKLLYSGGMLNAIPKKYDNNGSICRVLVQGRGYNFRWEEQWLVKGYHSTAKTLEQAKKQVLRLRKAEAERLLAIRRENLNIREIRSRNAQKIVTIEISQKAGNCYAGSSSFANKFCLELDAKVKLGDLYRLDKSNQYTKFLDKIAVWLEKQN